MAEQKTQQNQDKWIALPRMTVKNIGGKPRKVSEEVPQVYIGRIWGEANGSKIKELSSGDPMTIFVGDFRATNMDGDKFECNRMSLPESISESLEAALAVSAGKPVAFAFDLYANFSANSPVGYGYAVKSLVKTEASNRVEEMTVALLKTKALPAAKS